MAGRGRGRENTLPAWMTAGELGQAGSPLPLLRALKWRAAPTILKLCNKLFCGCKKAFVLTLMLPSLSYRTGRCTRRACQHRFSSGSLALTCLPLQSASHVPAHQ